MYRLAAYSRRDLSLSICSAQLHGSSHISLLGRHAVSRRRECNFADAQMQGKSSTIARKEGEDAVAVHCLVGFGLILSDFVWLLCGSGSVS